MHQLEVLKTKSHLQERNKAAQDSGGQIKVLGLNGIVGQMTRHCCLSAHSHPLPQKHTNAPTPHHPPAIPPIPASTAFHLSQRRVYFIFSKPTAGENPPFLLQCKHVVSQSVLVSTGVFDFLSFLQYFPFNPSIKKDHK